MKTALRRAQRRRKNDGLVTNAECAGTQIPDAPLPAVDKGTRLRVSGLKLSSLPTFFAAAKKVGAAPHRGNANRPTRNQGKANALRTQKKRAKAKKHNNKTEPRAAGAKKNHPLRGQKVAITSASNPYQPQTDTSHRS
ncbi:hypothetical protein F6X40_22085 [Paraburkholderia sp. UCT31]|uniref:hypothetical protein n=1 Tax=Paraburkholderia sp. UCT31 TaxID=2615209 RepID=UPI00165670A9|nr:hypothetical protein [Paraburkholderia sp. UCT31]MBC8739433.1 hypothetical protein [Paraburkholderia sp. UCT31]